MKEKIKESENEQIKNLKKQIDDLQEKLSQKIEKMKKIEQDIKNYENDCKKLQTQKEQVDAINDTKIKRKNETADNIERLKNDIENEKRNMDHNDFALENLKKENSNLTSKKVQLEAELDKAKKEAAELGQVIELERKQYKEITDEYKMVFTS